VTPIISPSAPSSDGWGRRTHGLGIGYLPLHLQDAAVYHERALDLASGALILHEAVASLVHDGDGRRRTVEVHEAEAAVVVDVYAQDFVPGGVAPGFEEGSDVGFVAFVGHVANEERGLGGTFVLYGLWFRNRPHQFWSRSQSPSLSPSNWYLLSNSNHLLMRKRWRMTRRQHLQCL